MFAQCARLEVSSSLLSREGNYTQVRIAAFDGLFLTKWYTSSIMRYVFAVMANDSSRVIRRHVARTACHSLVLLAQMGEMKSTLKETESLLIEEDGTHPEKAKDPKKSELDAMIKVLRKDREVGKNEVLREFLMPIALYVFNSICTFALLIIPVEHLTLTRKCAGASLSLPIFLSVQLKKRLRL